jgi:outer membrane protein OmpA-like peptidoglycan-associated protein
VLHLVLLLEVVVPVKKDEDIAKALNIKMIYFDLDKSYIRPDAALELEKILAVMQENPTMTIDIRSHTDCRQTVAYNAALSGRRAKSTLEWLVSKGIAKSRLTAKGYGESQLTNACPCEPTNESSCSEEEHQLNRRSEFIITAM